MVVFTALDPTVRASRRRRAWPLFVLLLTACGRSVRTEPHGVGAAGTAGSAEQGGNPGSGAGVSGSGVGGATAGAGGRGGSAAAGQPSTAGSGASAGGHDQCVDAPAWPLGCDPELNLTSTCSFEATCREVKCGEPWSEFDQSGCERTHCVSSNDCAQGERCVAAPLLGEFSCAPGYFEGCSVTACGQCACNFDPSCLGVSYCLPASEYPPANDCPLSHTYCSVYEHDFAMLANYLNADETDPGDTQTALRACRDKIQVERERCARQASGGSASADGGAPNAEAGAPNGGRQ